MARIRTIKPEFFRHEQLQELEKENPKAYVMLVFAALWGHCDKYGRFEWKPKYLALDILPFLQPQFKIADTLELLHQHGFIKRYEVDGKHYGRVLSFEKHQRITGKEAQDGGRFPDEAPQQQRGIIGEATGKHMESQEGKGKEGNGDKGALLLPFVSDEPNEDNSEVHTSFDWKIVPPGVSKTHWRDWLKVRRTKKGANTDSAWEAFCRECEKAGISIGEGVKICAEKEWRGFEASWIEKEERGNTSGLSELVDTAKRISTNAEDAIVPRKRVAT